MRALFTSTLGFGHLLSEPLRISWTPGWW